MSNFYARLTKVDEAKRQVWGRATQEVVDRSGEILDYESSKPLFQKWAEEFERDSNALGVNTAKGVVYPMHKDKVAGSIIDIRYNDVEKAIDIGCHITNEDEWNAVLAGAYRGFSIGGKYVDKWKDPVTKATRFTADPKEVSLVTYPCVSTAKFYDVIKSDGAIVKKSMYDVSSFLQTLSNVSNMAENLQSESDWEGDNSPVPAELKAWFVEGMKIWMNLAQEEASEVVAEATETPAQEAAEPAEKSEPKPEPTQALAKEEVKPMAEDLTKTEAAPAVAADETLKKMEDLEARLAKMADLEALVAEQSTKLAKMADLEKMLSDQSEKIEKMNATIDEYGKRPVASPAELAALATLKDKPNAFTKCDDSPDSRFAKAMKSALRDAEVI